MGRSGRRWGEGVRATFTNSSLNQKLEFFIFEGVFE